MIAACCLLTVAVVIGWPSRRVSLDLRGLDLGGFDFKGLVRVALADARRRPRRALAGSVSVVAAIGLLVGGLVAAVGGAVYAGLAWRALTRRAASRRAAASRAAELDGLIALAADLRAGLPPADLLAGFAAAIGTVGRIGGLARSVWVLAEQTGAPAAELVERIEADARAADRAAAAAAAQSAGAQMTALLLAGLPLAGIGLGFTAGVNPLRVLLHSSIGAASGISAVLLQATGLIWADKLAEGVAL